MSVCRDGRDGSSSGAWGGSGAGGGQSSGCTDGLVAQLGQALANTLAILAEADTGPQAVARLTWYVTDNDWGSPISRLQHQLRKSTAEMC